ncbi:hypothetical protein N474_24720 [Pseudoalteromonas luteoviolacea CPMOR-2]|uniref:Uncharacterized protein n=1 Tax=Pseudoalteromonas luteoviolacea DSM 6061 TaxID=1365250 RepID=A0A166W9S6_9GAMM|nr:hypothetical protein N475_17435 [Pseudoalteromonas luteoviolacea DSM 6061]KZN49918.1 hypothetical protein N474_24720 [Pseudoalteromonas luteoviolacea CPMOR-2]
MCEAVRLAVLDFGEHPILAHNCNIQNIGFYIITRQESDVIVNVVMMKCIHCN